MKRTAEHDADLGAFDSDALWSELDGLREIREGIEPAPEKKVGDLDTAGIIRTSDLAENLSILQILMGSGFKDASPVRFGVLTLRQRRGDTWSVDASGEVLEYVHAAAYETAGDLYAELWRLDRLARLFDSKPLLSSMVCRSRLPFSRQNAPETGVPREAHEMALV